MRARKTTDGLTVQATAGSYVVLLGMNLKKADCRGLLGFGIHRTDHQNEEAYWLEGSKCFVDTNPGFEPPAKYPTNEQPLQEFRWSDFTTKPGRKYTYRVVALYGTPEKLEPKREVSVAITTESEEGGNHDIYFNRGAAASQEYARRFGNKRPDQTNPDDPRWDWLSRGAMEAILDFVARAKDGDYGLRVAAYEFRLPAFAEALRAAHDRGADVQITYDANNNPPDPHGKVFPRDENRQTASDAKIKKLCIERVTRDDVSRPPISHHKFIVLLKSGKPEAILTGSTNFSLGGVFGQSNVVHVVEDPSVAAKYLQCWELIQSNPSHAQLQADLSALNNLSDKKPPKGVTTVFSPQEERTALDWYAKLANDTSDALFMTFAFGINKSFLEVYKNGTTELRFALLDKLLGPGVTKAKRPAAEKEMAALRFQDENLFAVGNRISTNQFDNWVKENLSGLNTHVQFIHTKFLLIDPLGDDPIVITGSANFSDASTLHNDENMLVIRGNKRVADIYLGEYLRLWGHYAFRDWLANGAKADATPQHLEPSDVWCKKFYERADWSRRRQYFSGSPLGDPAD